ncbi:MAG: LptF/LptG family permease [Candidatus Omnitrophica bacterium]|nr:LptF/LptG family permease [Candidatus Omnitrophota bacterium]
MRILDRYITKNLIGAYLFILLVFIGLYLIIDITSTLSDIIQSKPPAKILLEYYLNSLPIILITVSPFALLIGTLYAFGELNKNNEIISLRSCGLSITKIATPAIIISLIVSTALFFLQEKVLISSQKKVEDIKSEFIKKKVNLDQKREVAFTSGNLIIFSQIYSPKEKTLFNVLIFQEDENQKIIKQIACNTISYEYGKWKARGIIEYKFDETGKIADNANSIAEMDLPLKEKPKDLLLKKSSLSKYSTLYNARKRINSLKQIGESKRLTKSIVDYHCKIVEPFTSLFLIIGVLPLALEIKKRKAALSTLGIGFVLALAYFAIFSFSIALGKSGIFIPVLSVWLAPIFFLTVGITGLFLLK